MCRVDPTSFDPESVNEFALDIAMERNRDSSTDDTYGEILAILTEYPKMPDMDKLRTLSHFYDRGQKQRFLKLLGSLPVEMVRAYFFMHGVNYSYFISSIV